MWSGRERQSFRRGKRATGIGLLRGEGRSMSLRPEPPCTGASDGIGERWTHRLLQHVQPFTQHLIAALTFLSLLPFPPYSDQLLAGGTGGDAERGPVSNEGCFGHPGL